MIPTRTMFGFSLSLILHSGCGCNEGTPQDGDAFDDSLPADDGAADPSMEPDGEMDGAGDGPRDDLVQDPADTDPAEPPPCSCPDGFECAGGECSLACDVLVVGEGMGGTAAALAASSLGARTCLVAFQQLTTTPWISPLPCT